MGVCAFEEVGTSSRLYQLASSSKSACPEVLGGPSGGVCGQGAAGVLQSLHPGIPVFLQDSSYTGFTSLPASP